ncbi:hypothetical protein FRC07_001366 [Ceratobasidium sp. 392]|nr:hypothetical protein FRC07_001366 [Ceratobasidium sp. 392]
MSSPTRTIPSPISTTKQLDHGSKGRARSSSIVAVQEVGAGGADEMLDQSVYRNQNSDWVNNKAAKIIIDVLPGVTQEASWTIVNLGYLLISYVMFHGITGIPFDPDLHGGAYDDLTLWEQIDEGAQYTPAKKWLFTMPIGLFLVDEPIPSGAATPMTPMTPGVSGANTPVNRRSWAQASN